MSIVTAAAKTAIRYNFAARKLQRRLTQLGAEELFARGEGDEQHPEG